MTKATELIAAERQRQITEEGWDAEHDRGHRDQLIRAGVVYAQSARVSLSAQAAVMHGWPWERRFWKPTGDYVRDLVKAGALIAAAIDCELAERTSSDSGAS